jgi:hypothetical protein
VNSKARVIKVTCLPLYTILLSVGNPTVDFFSLDVEGAELEILKTIPWDKVNINVSSNILKMLRTSGFLKLLFRQLLECFF